MQTINRERVKIGYVLFATLLCAIMMSIVDSIIQPQYFIKSFIKICLFLGIASTYFFVFQEEIPKFKLLFHPNRKGILNAVFLGVLVYFVIVVGYFLLKNVFDFSGITEKLTSASGVNKDNFLLVSLYISLINSFLEEFLFRAFAFFTLKKLTNRTFAYVFSATAFALYHSGMTTGYFHFGIFALTLFALFVAGLFFNFLNEKSETLYPSWIVHACANLGINTVGCILFGIF